MNVLVFFFFFNNKLNKLSVFRRLSNISTVKNNFYLQDTRVEIILQAAFKITRVKKLKYWEFNKKASLSSEQEAVYMYIYVYMCVISLLINSRRAENVSAVKTVFVCLSTEQLIYLSALPLLIPRACFMIYNFIY